MEELFVKKIHGVLDDETKRLSIIFSSTVSDIHCTFLYLLHR